jgi:N-acetylmuramoyl-L-alanine amidase
VRRITTVILHHSAGPETTSPGAIAADHARRGIQAPGAYHYFLWCPRPEGEWQVAPMRPESRVGAHDQGQNAHSIGVCVAGDYTGRGLPLAARTLLVDLVADICGRYGLSAAVVEGHRENEPASTPTLCPGYDVEEVRRLVALRLGAAA